MVIVVEEINIDAVLTGILMVEKYESNFRIS